MTRVAVSTALVLLLCVPARGSAQALTWTLTGTWPDDLETTITNSMNEAVALYNAHGYFPREVWANYNPGVPTAQASYSGWIDFGTQFGTRVAMHEIAHGMGIGTYGGHPFDGWNPDPESAAARYMRLYEGQQAVASTGGTHFWPYGLNFDGEDGVSARERHVKMVAAFRFDMGIVVDSDGDLIPDDWEMHHFGTLAQTAEGDPDGDGIVNLDEYRTDADPTVACPVVDGHTYVIRSQRSGLLLSAIVPAAGDAFTLTEQRADDESPEQQWIARFEGEGWIRFENVESGWMLEVPGTDVASGLPVRQAPAVSAFHQQWRVVGGPGAEPGYWQIANRETARVVDGLVGTDEGTGVQQYPFSGNVDQQFWTFEALATGEEPESGAPTSDGGVPTMDGGTVDHDDDGSSGTLRGSCAVGGGAGGAAPWLLVFAIALMRVRRRSLRRA